MIWYKFKKWVSYFIDIPIETVSSEYTHFLDISLVKGRYQLSTEKAIYSFEDLYENFYSAFRQIKFEEHYKKILLLGLGLGSIIHILEKKFQKSFEYDAVEMDEGVIYLANKYTLHKFSSPISIFNTDAELYIRQSSSTYDLVAVDLFIDDIIPAKVQTKDFLEQIEKLINPGGILLYNILRKEKNEELIEVDKFESYFREVFPESASIYTASNIILINDKKRLTIHKL